MNQTEADAYLKKIGISKTIPIKASALGGLIRAHLEGIPFENLDVYDFGQVPSLEESKILEKVVHKSRGGYCFELNTLFQGLLKYLGFSVYPVAVRVMWRKENLPPVAHMALIVQIGSEKYFCDVGYGGPGPKGLITIEESSQQVEGEIFRMVRKEEGEWQMDRLHEEQWMPLLRFEDHAVLEQDFQLLNFYCAKSENILFTQKRVVNLCTPIGSKSLMDYELTVREYGVVKKMKYENLRELEKGLKKEFGIAAALDRSLRKENA